MKSLEQIARESAAKVRNVLADHQKRHKAAHDRFNTAYDALLEKHGLTINNLSDHHEFPPEFHADLAEHKSRFHDERAQINQHHALRVSELRPRVGARARRGH